MQRYQVQNLENGSWAVIDGKDGRAIDEHAGQPARTRLQAQALADFRNGISTPVHERTASRLQKLRLAWGMITAKRTA